MCRRGSGWKKSCIILVKVAIIGAGIAGAAAARTLSDAGIEVLVLEAG